MLTSAALFSASDSSDFPPVESFAYSTRTNDASFASILPSPVGSPKDTSGLSGTVVTVVVSVTVVVATVVVEDSAVLVDMVVVVIGAVVVVVDTVVVVVGLVVDVVDLVVVVVVVVTTSGVLTKAV